MLGFTTRVNTSPLKWMHNNHGYLDYFMDLTVSQSPSSALDCFSLTTLYKYANQAAEVISAFYISLLVSILSLCRGAMWPSLSQCTIINPILHCIIQWILDIFALFNEFSIYWHCMVSHVTLQWLRQNINLIDFENSQRTPLAHSSPSRVS